jgi:hypothetical protein
MRKTRNNRKPKHSKTTKYYMKGCSGSLGRKKCKKCNKYHKLNGGCVSCQGGGTSLGFFQNIQNIGGNFFNNILGVYNGLQTIPQPVSGDPWKGQYSGRKNF